MWQFLIFVLIVMCLATGIVAIVAPSATKYAAAGLVIIALIMIMLNPELIRPKRPHLKHHEKPKQ